MANVGTGSPAGHVLDARHLPAREDDLASDDHVLDPAVEGGELADAARRDKAAHGGDRLGLRRVTGGESDLANAILQNLQRHAALDGRLHVVRIDRDDLVHHRTVEHDRVLGAALQPTLGGGTAGSSHDVDAVLVGERKDLGDVVGALRHHDSSGHRHRVHPEDVLQLAEVVDAGASQLVGIGDHLVSVPTSARRCSTMASRLRGTVGSFWYKRSGQWKIG